MKRFAINASIVVILGLGIGLALLWLVAGGSAPITAAAEGSTELADVLHVCPSGCAYSSIQEAVDAAGDGDVIKVATGTYTGVQGRAAPPGYIGPSVITQVVYIDKTVTVRGGYTIYDWTTSNPEIHPTTLDAGGQGRVLLIAGDIAPIVEGLRLTGGDGRYGGGVYVITATATISNNQLFFNSAGYGSGVYLRSSNATISGNTIFSNIAGIVGGGLYLEGTNATISRNTIMGNYAVDGGGLSLRESDATISGNTITGNYATRLDGGGLYLVDSDVTISGNIITNNTCVGGNADGGGVYLRSSNATIVSNTITDNTAGSSGCGGGLCLDYSDVTISGNIISSNTAASGGGLCLYDGDVTVSGNTITGNYARGGGGLILRGSGATVSGNTVTDNSANRGGGLYLYLSANTVSGNTITGNTAGWDGGGLYLEENARDTLINNIVADNQAGVSGCGLYTRGPSVSLFHTTIAHNTGGDGSGVHVDSGTVVLTNTILVDQAVGIYVGSGSTATLESTLWDGNTTNWDSGGTVRHTNDYAGNPAFVDPDAGDYYIGPGSAAIDAGIDAGVDRDIDGDPRPAAFGFDIGADERPGASLHIHKAARPPYLNTGQTFTYTLVVTSAGVDTATDVWLTDTLPALQQAVDISTSQGSCTAGTGWGSTVTCGLGTLLPGASARITLTAQVTTTTPAQLPWPMRSTIWVRAAETSNTATADTTLHDCHVRLNNDPTEYSTVQAGVDASTQPGDVVKVSGYCVGVIVRAGAAQIVYLDKTLLLQGGWNTAFTQRDVARFPTTLDARGRGRVLYSTVPAPGVSISPTIEGLRFTGGDASGLGGVEWLHRQIDAGGGVYVFTATLVISDSQVFSNTAYTGGGLYLEASTATLSGNIVTDNTTRSYGGGLRLEASAATLTGNTVTDNTTHSYGGGLYLEASTATLSDNTVTDNTASSAGGLYLEASAATLSGNTVTDNTANYDGGGLYLFEGDATLNSNTIFGNTAGRVGGGLYLKISAAMLNGNTIRDNTADDRGGGLYLAAGATTLSGNTITDNTTDDRGGGLYLVGGDATLSGNTITDNTADDRGGGLYLGGTDATLTDNDVSANTAHYGGGLYLGSRDATLNGNTISGNAAYGHGGGLELVRSSATLINNIVADNQAGVSGCGLYIGPDSSVRLLHNTIAQNGAFGGSGDGSGVFVTSRYPPWLPEPSTVALTNTLLISHSVGISLTEVNTVTINGVLWYNTPITISRPVTSIVTVHNQHTGDPAFVDPDAGDYHIGPGSAAIDAGVDAGVDRDMDGDPRPVGSGYDLGADEARLFVTKRAIPDPVQPGAPLTYTICVTNPFDVELHATITDMLPDHITLGKTSAGTLILHGGVVTWTPVSIPPQGVWTDTVVVTVETGYTGSLVNVVEVNTEEHISGRYVHTLAPGLEVTKQAQAHANAVQPGEQLTYTIIVTNTGNYDLHATVTDTLPLSVTLDETSGGTLALPGGTVILPDGRVAVSWTPTITAPGDLWLGTILVTVDEGYSGPLVNLVEVTTEEGAAGVDSVLIIASRPLYLPLVLRELKGW